MNRPPRELLDRGAQLERTALAWQRTLLAFAASGALALRGGETAGLLWVEALGCALLALAGAGLVAVEWSYHREGRSSVASLFESSAIVWVTAAAGATVSVVAILPTLTSPT